MTGFEGYLIGGVVVALIAWRLAGRHVTVNNTNSATATASGDESSKSGGRSIVGWLLSIAIPVGVIAFALIALGNRVAVPAEQLAQVPAVSVAPVATVIAPITIDEYQPVALPIVNTSIDITPLLLLIAIAAVTLSLLYWWSYRSGSGAKGIARIKPIGTSLPIGVSNSLFDVALRKVKQSQEKQS